MEFFLAMGLAVGFAGLMSKVGTPSVDRGVGAIAQFLGGWRDDGWAHGVQEEDRDRPWGAATPASRYRLSVPELKPTVSRVKPRIHSA
jgi:hypothetical protein